MQVRLEMLIADQLTKKITALLNSKFRQCAHNVFCPEPLNSDHILLLSRLRLGLPSGLFLTVFSWQKLRMHFTFLCVYMYGPTRPLV